ncbi:MAG TPA: hypothetical protein PLU30_13815 [Verrucomicrobiae bacterium]|nr:hypothetical protein [Verrucomicrobiae bacterium]
MKLRNVTLEMSPKPFRVMREDAMAEVCRDIFRQWSPLTRHADQISVMLWTADGSEILDYRGRAEDEMEWARYIGLPNSKLEPVKGTPTNKNLHSQAVYYMDDPPTLTYGGLATIVRLLKRIGADVTGKTIRVGATFDPGGEFARSPFKYKRHNEICLGGTMGKGTFVCCYATLNADKEHYAGFPDGIPQDTPLGTFLGRQSQHFLKDLGFDYIWFSNGFGFGMETWKTTGPMFDGKAFLPGSAGEIREKILNFWRCFRKECPDFLIETRGTNLVSGSDLASNATPLRDIYAGGFNMVPPPNSPWAALNGDFGLELVGYMSRIAELPPGKGFPYRFYTHDPWWLNSPWLDRYGREPHDIYLPLAIGRINAEGQVENPDSIAFLTIDDSYGRTPDQVPEEVIPHVREAMRHAPDRPGPLVWVYPFDEYHDMTFGRPARLEEPFFGDWFMRAAVNNGLPINTVVSTKNFLSSVKHDPALYRESILITPVPDAGSALSKELIRFANAGGRVLLYGPLGHAGDDLLAALNVKRVAPIDGEMELISAVPLDELTEGTHPRRINHRPVMCAGGIDALLADPSDDRTHAPFRVLKGDERRVAAVWRPVPDWKGGMIAWVRGTNSSSYAGGHLLTPDDPLKWFQGDLLMRHMLGAFGWHIDLRKRDAAQGNALTPSPGGHLFAGASPIVAIARHDNGFFFSGCTRNTNVEILLRAPQGAPIFTGCETELREGMARYRMPRAWHRECRVFVHQEEGEVFCIERHSGEIGVTRRLKVMGLKDATLRFYPERGTREKATFLINPAIADGYTPVNKESIVAPQPRDDADGHYIEASHLTGTLLISW